MRRTHGVFAAAVVALPIWVAAPAEAQQGALILEAPAGIEASAFGNTPYLFSRESDPVKARPPGPVVTVLQRDSLGDLSVADVLQAVEGTLGSG